MSKRNIVKTKKSSTFSSDDNEYPIYVISNGRAVYANMIKIHEVVLNKYVTSSSETEKEEWIAKKGIHTINNITVGQLKKLLNNIKSFVKKKPDILTSGNKQVKLLE